jgi:hypothetical protein
MTLHTLLCRPFVIAFMKELQTERCTITRLHDVAVDRLSRMPVLLGIAVKHCLRPRGSASHAATPLHYICIAMVSIELGIFGAREVG